jgi:hypothetical protein
MIRHDINNFMRRVNERQNIQLPGRLDYSTKHYVNAYENGRAYGGPEEGGWWYDWLEPIASVRVYTTDQALDTYELFSKLYDDLYDGDTPISSVTHDADLVIYMEDEPAEHYPKETPRYE